MHQDMTKKLNYQSTFDDVGWSLRETLHEIKQHGETTQLICFLNTEE